MIRPHRVAAILGPSLSNSTFAAEPIVQQAGIPVIASSNTAPNRFPAADRTPRARHDPLNQLYP
jgi:branched-chain amino acid transport system substrate-binding protein